LQLFRITNVLPNKNRLEKGIAAFPDEIAYRLIKLFSYSGETVLDPFMGSGTTLKVARKLGRDTIGYEIDIELKDVIMEKIRDLGDPSKIKVKIRKDSKKLRTALQNRVSEKNGVK
jgi:modification methylase